MPKDQNKVPVILSAVIATEGVLVLLGWQFEIEFLKAPIPGLKVMNPFTAFGFILSAISIFLLSKHNNTKNNIAKTISIILSCFVLLIAFARIHNYITSTASEEDWVMQDNRLLSEKIYGYSSRIALMSAINFILLAVSTIISYSKKGIAKRIANYIALLIFFVSIFSLFGHVYFVPEFKGIPMAVHTGICFLLSSLGISLINRNNGFMRDFSGSGAGKLVARVLIPGILIFPFLLGLLLLYIVHNYNISAELVVAGGVSGITVIFFLISWYAARELNNISSKRDEAIRELTLSHERFFKFFKASPVPTNIIRIRDGQYIHANQAFLKLFSLTREQVIGKTSKDWNIIAPEKRENLLEHVRQNNYNLQDMEVTLYSTTGKRIDILTSTQTIEINGEPHMLNTLVDITERKKFEDELIKSRKSLNDAQKLSKTGSWEFNLKTGELYWSDELYRIFELEKTPADKLFEVCRKKIVPEDLVNLDNSINYATEKGESKVYEHRIQLSDGSIKHLLGLGEVIKNEKGEPEWLRGTTQDITERKEIEISLEKTKRSLSIAQKIAKLGSWEWDILTGKEIWSDEQFRIFGYEPGEIEASYSLFLNSLHPDDKNNVLLAVELALNGVYKFETEYRIITKDGEIKYLEAKATVEKNQNGKPIFMRGIVFDITERKLTSEKLSEFYNQLEVKNKELEQFAFIASHDLQEPLRTISSFTDLFIEEYSGKLDSNATTYIRFISQSASRMRDLINGLLEYSRLGKNVTLKQTDCNVLLNNTMANLHAAISESNAIITASKLPIVNGFPVELELLFQNLIGNAIKFRKKNTAPEIKIHCEKKNKEWIFSVSDNGIGIETKHFDKIFKLFQRLHSRDVYEGSGIGLSHCKKIVELHNGNLWLESTPGVGTVFYFSIPEMPR